MSIAQSFRDAYEARLRDGWQTDPAQQSAIAALGSMLAGLTSQTKHGPRGLYLHGPVGRGKTQLLNMFMEHLGPASTRRTHMHSFMVEIHRRLFEIKSGDPVIQTAQRMAEQYRVLGFDEFYISNIADGMLLGRLFEHLFKLGVVVVATSNWPIHDLYRDGHNRKSLLPSIRILERHMQSIDLGEGEDYRRGEQRQWSLYFVTPAGSSTTPPQLAELFEKYAEPGMAEPPDHIRAEAFQGKCGWYRFSELCGQPLGRSEYLDLVRRVETLIIEGIPLLTRDQADLALRLVTLIDLCYEHNTRVIVSAAGHPEELYPDGPETNAFRRVVSRLAEMQTWG